MTQKRIVGPHVAQKAGKEVSLSRLCRDGPTARLLINARFCIWRLAVVIGHQHAYPALNPLPSSTFVDTRRLRLDLALHLLEQAGATLPATEPGSEPWLQSILDALCDLSSKDGMTGLLNRRSFEMALAREADRAARSGESALLLLLDVDHFKSVNDTHGHAAGDEVIKAVALTLAHVVRPMDTVARVGGEEFAVILPNCGSSYGTAVAERIRNSISTMRIAVSPGKHISITVSVGGAFAPEWVRSSPLLWMERSDRQLYRAKAEGRNRACMEPQLEALVTAEEKGMLFAMSLQDLPQESE